MPFHSAGMSPRSGARVASGHSLGTISSSSGCSGASTMYVAPNSVSGRVVNTSMSTPSCSSTGNATVAPTLRPIQLRCIVLIDSGQSSRSRSASRRSAYAVICSFHCFNGRRNTGWLPRSLRPSGVTSSLASTVPSAGHQLTIASSRYASRYESTTAARVAGSRSNHASSSGLASLSGAACRPRTRRRARRSDGRGPGRRRTTS